MNVTLIVGSLKQGVGGRQDSANRFGLLAVIGFLYNSGRGTRLILTAEERP